MVIASRLLALCCVALLVTGAAGAVGLSPRAAEKPPTALPALSPAGPTTSRPAPEATTASAPPSSSSALGAGLIRPADMGGFYHSAPAVLAALLDSSPCLAALQPSPAQAGRAAEALSTGDRFSVPEIIEIVASYPGSQPRAVFDSTAAAVKACARFAFNFNGVSVAGPLGSQPLTTSADAGTAWSVPFEYQGVPCVLQMALVLQGQDVFFLGWADTASPSPAVMGGFASTVTAAVGEEA